MSKRILLVDDEASVRTLISSALRGEGWSVEEAQDGGEGLARLRGEPGGFDLVISDVSMPAMSGPEMLAAAEAALGHAKVVLISGFAAPASLMPGRAVRFLQQPIHVPSLVGEVRELLA